ncbi:hypothetical protein [Mycobacterium simulans]|uniref:hypothetical protein n=1 Tax=Mycobacterium simulans TaxID=627089 RepID=UPI001C902619|nr:hypothetical protein [Mycobacterium simulans]
MGTGDHPVNTTSAAGACYSSTTLAFDIIQSRVMLTKNHFHRFQEFFAMGRATSANQSDLVGFVPSNQSGVDLVISHIGTLGKVSRVT